MDTAEQLYVALRHASGALGALDRDLGLSPARSSVLATLRYEGPQRLGELARLEGVTQPTMTQTVQALEAAELVQRRPTKEDRRGCVVALTAKGRSLVRRSRARKITWVDEVVQILDPGQRQVLHAVAVALDRQARRATS